MKVSVEWLRDYVEITESANELGHLFSNIGFNTEGIEEINGSAVIDLEITSNRGDCLSHIGIAREIAAATGRELKLPKPDPETVQKEIKKLVSVEIAEPNLCGRYTARVIQGIKVGTSPDWMVKRLDSLGIRSVNNVVDAANYAMIETGQPPHAFDLAKIKNGKIVVRKAEKGETLVSIDGTECKLDEQMLIIADDAGPVAIAGIMGGLETEVSDTTTDVLLEDASFDPVSVRTTSRTLTLSSESSFRFERIVDIQRIDFASLRTAELIIQVAGGKLVESIVDVYPEKTEKKNVSVRLDRVNKLLGIDVPQAEAARILHGLQLAPEIDGDTIHCSIPSWRSDITREADLIEEIARIHGYDNIYIKDKINIKIVAPDRRQQVINAVNSVLNGLGFYEAINVSFTDEKTARLTTGNGPERHLAVKDVIRKNANVLRSSLIGSMLDVLRANYNAGNKNIKIYEIANVFEILQNGDRYEGTRLCIGCDSDFRLLKAAVENALKAVRKNAIVQFTPGDAIWAKAAGAIIVDGNKIGTAGAVSDIILKEFNIKGSEVYIAELDFDSMLAMVPETVKMKPIPKYPAIERVLSVIVDEDKTWAQMNAIITENAPAELENVNFEGIYRGKPIEPGKKSVTVSLRFRDEDGTLRHEIVDDWEKSIVDRLTKKINATLRTA